MPRKYQKQTVSIFAERLKIARKLRGVGSAELSAKIDSPRTDYIDDLEHDKFPPWIIIVIRISDALRVNSDWLQGRSEEMELPK